MKFIKEFIKHPIIVGAIAPSSQWLSELISDTANLKNKKCVVELGPWNGVFTEKILQKINPYCVFFSIEINYKFVKETKNRCSNAIVYNDSAENIKKYLIKHNKNNCDCIISGLPWAVFDSDLQIKLLNSIYDSLESEGIFLTFTYIHGLLLPQGKKFKALLQKKFRIVKRTKIIWWNLPPAFVYFCQK